MATQFTAVYNCFLGKITDDLYIELTPEDTLRDLQALLLNCIPEFEFPRQNLYDYTLKKEAISADEITENDIAISWSDDKATITVDRSEFGADLTPEEVNILALLMLCGWVQRQITSIEVTRMKYSGTDWKMTSQANHLSKLLSLQDKTKTQTFHMQRLYKRRRPKKDGGYESNWDIYRSMTGNLK